MSLFARDPETLDGYVPKFSYEDILMGYQVEKQKHGRWSAGWDEDDSQVEEEHYTYSITVLGHKIYGKKNDYYGDALDTIAAIANEFTSATSEDYHPEVHKFLKDNAVDLNNARRYWTAVLHRNDIEKTRRKAAELLEQCRRAEWVASMNAVQVKAERWLSQAEKDLLLAEFSAGEYHERLKQ